MSVSVEQAFTATASLYDRNRARLIPGFEGLYRSAVELVPADAASILDLGAGTGLLTAHVRTRLPDSSFHLIDVSAAMLDRARERLAGDSRVSFEVADYSAGKVQGRYHAVISALSIHHLQNDAKRLLFRWIKGVLAPGGMFINAEQVLGPTPALEALYRAEWLRRVKALGATEQEIGDSLFRQQQDHCASVEEQLSWMRTEGFEDVDCWFKDGRFATLAGRNPA